MYSDLIFIPLYCLVHCFYLICISYNFYLLFVLSLQILFMDDSGVAYMVMGEGGEMTPVTPQPSTQVVAIDNGDGTQQFAIPVMDPETGQENYIVIDPETAANITNGSAEVVTSGNQLMVVNTGTGTAEVLTTGAGLQETEAQPAEAAVMEAGEVEAGVMVMLPSGEQGLVVTGPEDLEGLTSVYHYVAGSGIVSVFMEGEGRTVVLPALDIFNLQKKLKDGKFPNNYGARDEYGCNKVFMCDLTNTRIGGVNAHEALKVHVDSQRHQRRLGRFYFKDVCIETFR